MDKYSKFILTVIAIGLILNVLQPLQAVAASYTDFTGIAAALNSIASAISYHN